MKTVTSQRVLPFTIHHLLADCRSRLSWSWLFQQVCGFITVVALGTLSYLLISNFIFQSIQVDGSSMSPTLSNNDNYWLNRSVYLRHEPQRADIVAAKDPEDGCLVVKRIIAMPGECIYLNRGKVYVNGKLLDEPYLSKYVPTYAYEKNESELILCGKDQFFVMGDNRNNSCDSRTYGPVPRQNILGRVVQ